MLLDIALLATWSCAFTSIRFWWFGFKIKNFVYKRLIRLKYILSLYFWIRLTSYYTAFFYIMIEFKRKQTIHLLIFTLMYFLAIPLFSVLNLVFGFSSARAGRCQLHIKWSLAVCCGKKNNHKKLFFFLFTKKVQIKIPETNIIATRWINMAERINKRRLFIDLCECKYIMYMVFLTWQQMDILK